MSYFFKLIHKAKDNWSIVTDAEETAVRGHLKSIFPYPVFFVPHGHMAHGLQHWPTQNVTVLGNKLTLAAAQKQTRRERYLNCFEVDDD